MTVVLTPKSEETRVYEILILLPHPLSDAERSQALSAVEDAVSERGGSLLHTELWSRRGLAFPIRKHTEGRFLLCYIESQPDAVRGIDHALRLDPIILRHLIVCPPKGYEVTSWEERYREWCNQRTKEEEVSAQEREESLKKTIVRKATRSTKSAPAPTTESSDAPDAEHIDAEISKVISEEDLKL